MLPDDQERARDAPNRAEFERALKEVLHSRREKAPPFSNEDLDRLRAQLGGQPFAPQPNLKRVGQVQAHTPVGGSLGPAVVPSKGSLDK